MARVAVFAGVSTSKVEVLSASPFIVGTGTFEAPCCRTSNVFLQLMPCVTGHHSFTLKIDLAVLHFLSA